MDWVDAAKGVAIVLVVLGHAWRGINTRGLIPEDLFLAVDLRIYAFHMPVFFALSGMFVARSLARQSPGDYVKSRITRLIWPMVLWTYLFLATKLLAGQAANNPVALEDLLIWPIPGQLHFWFLWALFLLQIALLAARPLISDDGRFQPRTLVLLAVISVAIALVPRSGEVGYWIGKACAHAPFLVMGMILGQVLDLSKLGRPVQIGALLGFALLLTLWPSLPALAWVQMLGAGVLTLCFLTVLSALGPRIGKGMRGLVGLGAASMAIYLSHTIFSAALREMLLKLGIDNLALHVLGGTVIGIIGALVVLVLARWTGTRRLLGF